MRTLLLFFMKHRFLMLFIVLETVSVILLVHSYSYQRTLTLNAVNDLTGEMFEISSNVSDYFLLKKQNADLVKENSRLHNRLESMRKQQLPDTLSPDSAFRYMAAKVVSNSVNRRNNYILVNKGSLDGVEKEMAAVSPDGLAGVVVGVSPHYALIMSMLHENAAISARIKKNNQLVTVLWKTDDYRLGTVTDIPSHIELNKGDTVVTSGFSLIFPPDIVIGTIDDYRPDKQQSLNNATLRFATDFKGLHHLYLIKNLKKKEEQELLEKEVSL